MRSFLYILVLGFGTKLQAETVKWELTVREGYDKARKRIVYPLTNDRKHIKIGKHWVCRFSTASMGYGVITCTMGAHPSIGPTVEVTNDCIPYINPRKNTDDYEISFSLIDYTITKERDQYHNKLTLKCIYVRGS